MHLFSLPIDTRYACGDSLTLADCVPWVVWKKTDLVGGGTGFPGEKNNIFGKWRFVCSSLDFIYKDYVCLYLDVCSKTEVF